MKLSVLVAAIAAAGEDAIEGARRAYSAHVEALNGEQANLPGQPPRSTVVPLDTMVPERLSMKTTVTVDTDADGDVDVDFAPRARRWCGRAATPLADIEIEWSRKDAPEGVCRIRDRQNLAQDRAQWKDG